MNCIPKAPGSSVTKNSIHLSEPEAEQQKPSLVSSGLCQILSGVPVKSTLYVGVDKSQGCANALFAGKKIRISMNPTTHKKRFLICWLLFNESL